MFKDNSAKYGPDIASYAIKVVEQNSSSDQVVLNNVGSGIRNDEFVFQLVDHDNNVLLLENATQIIIAPSSSNQMVLGTRAKTVNAGVAIFDDLILVSQPGKQHEEFRVSSKAIDSEKLLLQYGISTFQNSIDVSFRQCKPGEIEQNGQ